MEHIDAAVRALWPDAPVRAADDAGRWLRAEGADGASVYLQVYAWSDDCRPHYLVARVIRGGAVDQQRFVCLDEAVAALRTHCCAGAANRAVVHAGRETQTR